MDAIELLMRRRNVHEFIRADKIEVVFTRKAASVKTDAGGYTPGAPETLEPQTVRIVLNKRRFNRGIVNSEAGDIPHTDYLLIGDHNLDIQVEDRFVYQGDNYHIVNLFDSRTESVLASIDLLGKDNRA